MIGLVGLAGFVGWSVGFGWLVGLAAWVMLCFVGFVSGLVGLDWFGLGLLGLD